MKEFMLLVRNEIDHQAAWSPEQHRQFLKKCEEYIGNLTKEGKLKSAQPLNKGRQDYFRLKRDMGSRAH